MAAVVPTVSSRNVPVGRYRMTTVRYAGTLIGDYFPQSAFGFQRIVAAWGADAAGTAQIWVRINTTTGSDTVPGAILPVTASSSIHLTVIGE